jgi:hypothetical protein
MIVQKYLKIEIKSLKCKESNLYLASLSVVEPNMYLHLIPQSSSEVKNLYSIFYDYYMVVLASDLL